MILNNLTLDNIHFNIIKYLYTQMNINMYYYLCPDVFTKLYIYPFKYVFLQLLDNLYNITQEYVNCNFI